MNSMLRTTTVAAFLAGISASAVFAAAEQSPGYVDFGKIAPAAEGKFVEVDLPEGLIKFAAKLATKEEPQAAEVLGNLKHVRVNVVELNDANRNEVVGRVRAVRQELTSQGWSPIVNVREQPKGDDVQIFARLRGEEAIEGLVITVIEGQHEVVLVNIVGNIKPEQIATLAERFNIEPLKRFKVAEVK
jgi:Domain of unknown function (DUF4252)